MSETVPAIPEGLHSLTPHIVVNDARKAIEFYQAAFGARVRAMFPMPDGKIMHAVIVIGDSALMLNDEFPEMGSPSPATTKTDICVRLQLYVPDADKVFNAAVQAGAKIIMPMTDMFWGDRYGQVVDPFGHHWSIATHVKNMTMEELKAAGDAAIAKMSAAAS
jgi:uncharacterized glyoxalase superfamily protein PhnB